MAVSNNNVDNKIRLIKIMSTICFLLLTIALIIVKNAPATQYEASIYSSTPVSLWFFLVISIIAGFTIIVHQIYTREYENNNLWIIGMALIFLSYAMSLSLYIIRGYYMWNARGDIASHIGWIKQIAIDGHTPSNLIYPITHIYFNEFSQILGTDFGTDLFLLIKLIPLLFGLLYVPFMYIFAKSILSDNGQIILATAASSTFVHGWYLTTTPNHLSNLLLPLALFILIKAFTARKIEWEILLIIMIFLYPVFHPVPSLALIIILITLWLPPKVFHLTNNEINTDVSGLDRFNVTLLTILFVWAIAWISSFYVWESTIQKVYRSIIAEGGPSHISELADQVASAQGYGYNVYEQILKVMGSTIVYIILALICIPIIWKIIQSNKKIDLIFLLYGPLVALGTFILVLFAFDIIFGPLRMMIYISIITTIFVGFILHEIINKSRNTNQKYISKFACGLIIVFLVGVFLGGMMNLYPSPYILKTNPHSTQTELNGMNWLFNNRNLDIDITGMTIAPKRLAELLLTSEEVRAQNVPYYLEGELIAPYHFGYDNDSLLSNSYEKDMYLALTDRDKSIYIDIFPEIAELRWTSTDFDKLEYDLSVDKLYSNDGFDIWYIND